MLLFSGQVIVKSFVIIFSFPQSVVKICEDYFFFFSTGTHMENFIQLHCRLVILISKLVVHIFAKYIERKRGGGPNLQGVLFVSI